MCTHAAVAREFDIQKGGLSDMSGVVHVLLHLRSMLHLAPCLGHLLRSWSLMLSALQWVTIEGLILVGCQHFCMLHMCQFYKCCIEATTLYEMQCKPQ